MKRTLLFLMALLLIVGNAWGQNKTTHPDGVYKIYWDWNDRGYLTYHNDYPTQPQLSGVELSGYQNLHYKLTDSGINLSWYLYTSPETGKTYLFEATTGKFISFGEDITLGQAACKTCVLTENVTSATQLDLYATTNTEGYMLRYVDGSTNWQFCSGCGTAKGGHPVRFVTDGQGDGGIPFVFVSNGASISDDVKNTAINKIKAFENSLLETKYYRIKSKRGNYYLHPVYSDATCRDNHDGPTLYVYEGQLLICAKAKDESDASQIWTLKTWDERKSYKMYSQGKTVKPLSSTADTPIELGDNGGGSFQVTLLTDGFYAIGTYGASIDGTGHQPFFHLVETTNGTTNGKFPQSNNGFYIAHWAATADASKWTLEEVTDIKITIGAGGYSTMNFDFPVQLPEGLKGNTIVGEEGNVIELMPTFNGATDYTNKVPAKTPLILEGEEGKTYSLTILSDYSRDYFTNNLSGTLLPKSFEEGHGKNIYGIATVNNETKFYKMTSGATTIGKNKAYYDTTTSGISKFDIRFGETTTNISNAVNEENVLDKVYYDLNGRRVFYPTRGIYVTGSGKKVFVK